MKLFISFGMEGVAGIVDWSQSFTGRAAAAGHLAAGHPYITRVSEGRSGR